MKIEDILSSESEDRTSQTGDNDRPDAQKTFMRGKLLSLKRTKGLRKEDS